MNDKPKDKPYETGGPGDHYPGERSVSGRACLPILIAMIGIVTVLTFVIVTAAQAAPRLAGHRGATGVAGAPEESQAAVRYAARHGAAIVEGDVQFTADDYAVMLHDSTLDRTTACSGPVSRLRFAELRKCAPASAVPQLLFWLREAKTRGLVALVEVKRPPTAHQLAVLARTVKAEAPARTVVSSFHPETLDAVRGALGDQVRLAPIIGPTGSPFGYSVAEHARQYDLILADFRWLIVARVGWYHAAGVEVWGWTGRTPQDYRRMRALKLDAMIVDDVRRV